MLHEEEAFFIAVDRVDTKFSIEKICKKIINKKLFGTLFLSNTTLFISLFLSILDDITTISHSPLAQMGALIVSLYSNYSVVGK